MSQISTARPRRGGLFATAWLALCLAPYLVCFSEVGFLSEDFTALVYAHDLERAASDLSGAQYGLAQPRFYRPWVSLSLGLEARLFGFSPLLLKLSHLLALAVGCLSLRALARRLGLGAGAACFAGLLAAWFPFGAGSVLWVVGRVDAHLFGFGLAFLALHARAEGWGEGLPRPRRLRARLGALVCCALAMLTKETAFALPLILGVLELARPRGGDDRRGLAMRLWPALPALLLAAALFAWRAHCLGTWIGGYAGGAGVLDGGASWGRRTLDLLAALGDLALAGPLAWGRGELSRAPLLVAAAAGIALLLGVLGAVLVGVRKEGHRARVAVASGAWVLLACAPLVQLWSDPAFATNARAYWLAWCGVALGFSATLAQLSRMRACLGGLVCLGVALSGLIVNVRDHVDASRAVEALRAELIDGAPARGGRPALIENAPKNVGSAYAFTFGLREALQPPFSPIACEIAAYRPLFPAASPLPPLPRALAARFAPQSATSSPAPLAPLAERVGWTQLVGDPPAISGEEGHAWFARWLEVQGAERAVQLAALPTLELPGFGPRVRLAFLSSLGSASAEIALPAEPRPALHVLELFVQAPILSSGEGALYVPLEVVDKGGDRCWIFAESLDEQGAPNGPVSDLLELRFTPSFGPLLQPSRK
ncbi:MAG: hypothetical protein JNM84_03735 [Planctomycetes bacterium]|nr:hypothetical protein [Planctomycetota bacterium]